MKKVWDPEDKQLFRNNRFSAEGLSRYWSSVDNAIQFNMTTFFNSSQHQSKGQLGEHRGPKLQQHYGHDRFHWSWNSRQRIEQFNRENDDYSYRNPVPKSLNFANV